MIRPELVEYLRENLKTYSAQDLRKRLADEGVSDVDFDESLKAASAAPQKSPKRNIGRNRKLLFLASGALLCLGAGMMLFNSQGSGPQETPSQSPVAMVLQARAAFLGRYGYVVHLPPGYGYVQDFADPRKTIERVYFCKTGTSRADFIDSGLYGQLGIVRMEARPSPWAGETDGPARLAAAVVSRLRAQNDEFTFKDLEIGDLRGIEIDFTAPFSHVEAYLLGEKTMFSFYAGKDGPAYQAIVTSLRDETAED